MNSHARLSFDPFFENSSSADILHEFCTGGSLNNFVKDCRDHYDERLAVIAGKLRALGVSKARRRARYHIKKWYPF